MTSTGEGSALPMSKWMRRTERVDFMDMCASSPPSDGIFYPDSRTGLNYQSTGEFTERRLSNSKPEIPNCIQPDQGGFFKSITTTTNYTQTNIRPGKVLNMDSASLEKWAKANIRGEHIHSSDDSAPTPVDHVPQYQRIVPRITKSGEGEEHGNHFGVVEKFSHTPDITPCTTPSITPAGSPMMHRKGNPFFTGDPNRREEGSWLFRPGPKNQDNMLYQAKVEIQAATGTQPGSKSVRMVPKPSSLRELNFFSPTSM